MSNKFYITTTIPYVNAAPHIGFALEIIQADVIARYNRQLERDVFFLTGTDEHGFKMVETANSLGITVEELVNLNSQKFQELNKILNISNSDFIRTSDKQRHWPTVQKLWRILKDNGDIYKGIYKGRYCPRCEAFLTDKEMDENYNCLIHKITTIETQEENYLFKLSKFQSKLLEIINKGEIKILPEFRKNEVISFINQGLKDVSFSRPIDKLQWGIPVPDDPSQIIYVWADALTNYLSGVDFLSAGANFQRFWPPDVQVLGKDVSKFHAIIWPAILLSAGLPLPKTIFIHGFITINGEKISKSQGNVIDPFKIVQEFGTDPLRYFLLKESSPFDDLDYTLEKFQARYNGDLANGLGNLTSRVIKLISLYKGEIYLKTNDFEENINQSYNQYHSLMKNYKFNEALDLINYLIKQGDNYLNTKKPWEFLNSNLKSIDFENCLSSLIFLLANISQLIFPFIPETSNKILSFFGLINIQRTDYQNRKIQINSFSQLFPRKN